MSNLRTLPCDGHEARARAHIAPSSELRLHAMIALCLYHGSSEVALDAAMAEIDAARAAELTREAESELSPFGARMAPDVREKALGAAFHRLVREALGLPVLTYES